MTQPRPTEDDEGRLVELTFPEGDVVAGVLISAGQIDGFQLWDVVLADGFPCAFANYSSWRFVDVARDVE